MKSETLKSLGFTNEQLSMYRNYFEGKAIAAGSTKSAFYALNGLMLTNGQVTLKSEGNTFLSTANESNLLNFSILDSFGNPTSIKSIEKTSVSLQGDKKAFSVIDSAKLVGGNKITVNFGETLKTMAWGSYSLKFELLGSQSTFVVKTFTVGTQIDAQSIEASIVSQSASEMELKANVKFVGETKERPSTMWAIYQKKGQLPYQVQGTYDSATDSYKITANLRELLKEKVNGNYQLSVHSADPRASNVAWTEPVVVDVQLDGGSAEHNNSGMRPDY